MGGECKECVAGIYLSVVSAEWCTGKYDTQRLKVEMGDARIQCTSTCPWCLHKRILIPLKGWGMNANDVTLVPICSICKMVSGLSPKD